MPVRCLKITIGTWNQKESLKKIFFKKHGWLSVVQLLKWRTSSLKRRSDNLSDSVSDFAVEERGSGFVSAMRTAGWTFASLQPKTQFERQFKNWRCTAKIYTAPVKSFDTLSHSREWEAVLNFWLVLYKGQTWQESTVVIYYIIFIYIR